MDKQLFIACLKENFEYLDFWEKNRTPALKAMVTLVQYARNKGKQFPAERLLPYYTLKRVDWPKNIVGADNTLSSFSANLSKFGISFHYNSEFDGWLGLQLLDPKYKEIVPERISHFLVYSEPAIIQLTKNFDSPDEWPNCWNLADMLPNFEDMLPNPEDMLPDASTPLPPARQLKPSQRLLLVDLSRKKGEILEEFKKFLDVVDKFRKRPEDLYNDQWEKKYTQWKPDKSRERPEVWKQLKIWRMRKERISFSEIAKGLKITEDAAKKSFYKAYERTQGRSYDPDKYRKDGQKINKWDLTKTCQTCPDRRSCSELCPEIMRFVDQDDGSIKEKNMEDGNLADFTQYKTWKQNERSKPD
jgi:hypothetical protein